MSMLRPLVLALGLAALPPTAAMLSSSPALAGETMAFTTQAFQAAQKAGGPILVEVWAPWCSVCRSQKPVLAKLMTEPKYRQLTVLRVDFDSQKDVLRQLRVNQQSTLVSFKGSQETGRSTGVVDANAIDAQLSRAL